MNKLAQEIRFDKSLPYDGKDFVEKIIAVRVREIDEFITRWLYETYKRDKVSTIYVLSEEEFRKFLIKYLPLYQKEEGKH